jgi:hypothetical protein
VAHIYNRNWKLEHIITGGDMNSDGLVSNKDFIEIGKPRDTPYIVYENFISAQTKILKYTNIITIWKMDVCNRMF